MCKVYNRNVYKDFVEEVNHLKVIRLANISEDELRSLKIFKE